jgi:23S rRNA pseudouridine1911/1915/1917 synthase
VKKIYHALVCGEPGRATGEIRAAIARHPTHRKRMAVRDDSGGRAAHTSYKILERLYATTLMEAQIHTGRTHQIRVHFQFIGHPLLGDDTYGAKQNARVKELTNYAAPRVMLHAKHLSFVHPRTKKPMDFAAPLPADFQAALKRLRVKD